MLLTLSFSPHIILHTLCCVLHAPFTRFFPLHHIPTLYSGPTIIASFGRMFSPHFVPHSPCFFFLCPFSSLHALPSPSKAQSARYSPCLMLYMYQLWPQFPILITPCLNSTCVLYNTYVILSLPCSLPHFQFPHIILCCYPPHLIPHTHLCTSYTIEGFPPSVLHSFHSVLHTSFT